MSSKTLEGMIRKRSGFIIGHKDRPDQFEVEKAAMKAALLWLADNVSDEMAKALRDSLDECPPDKWLPAIGYAKAISAALRAAGDGR